LIPPDYMFAGAVVGVGAGGGAGGKQRAGKVGFVLLLLATSAAAGSREHVLSNAGCPSCVWATPATYRMLFCPKGFTADHVIPNELGGPSHPCNYICMPHKGKNDDHIAHGINNAKAALLGAPIAALVGVEAYGTALACTVAWGGNDSRPNKKAGKKSERRVMGLADAEKFLDDICPELAKRSCKELRAAFRAELAARPDENAWTAFGAHISGETKLNAGGYWRYMRLLWPDLSDRDMSAASKEQALDHQQFGAINEKYDELTGRRCGAGGKELCTFRHYAHLVCRGAGICAGSVASYFKPKDGRIVRADPSTIGDTCTDDAVDETDDTVGATDAAGDTDKESLAQEARRRLVEEAAAAAEAGIPGSSKKSGKEGSNKTRKKAAAGKMKKAAAGKTKKATTDKVKKATADKAKKAAAGKVKKATADKAKKAAAGKAKKATADKAKKAAAGKVKKATADKAKKAAAGKAKKAAADKTKKAAAKAKKAAAKIRAKKAAADKKKAADKKGKKTAASGKKNKAAADKKKTPKKAVKKR